MRATLKIALLTLSATAALGAAIVMASWWHDESVLRRTALRALNGAPLDEAGIARLNDWVYHDGGFAKNHAYFLIPRIGATPVEILHSGGDCADKSRLLSAMLESLGVRSGLAMLYPCPSCRPVHTVVEVRSIPMVLDPIWDLDYGRSLDALRESDYAASRVVYLRIVHKDDEKMRYIPAQDVDFRYAKSINFEADIGTRVARSILRIAGIGPQHLMRPRVLEDPKLLIACAAGFLSLLALVGAAMMPPMDRLSA